VINDKLQGSIAELLSCDELLHSKFVIHFAGERIFKIGEHLANGWLCHMPYTFVVRDAKLTR